MIGRPRRRHVIDHNGRLQKVNQSPVSAITPPIHRSKSRSSAKATASHWLKLISVGLAGLIAVFLLWTLVGSFVTYSRVTDKNSTKKAPALSFLGEVKPNQLQGEGDGRVNVLLIGIGGAKHPGGSLADTLMVVSFDPKNKEVALLSIPRDLWVPIEGHNYAKINSAHSYGEKQAKNGGGGPALTKKTVSKVLDLPIHYYIRLDFSGLEKLVDALGGVSVDVENPIVDLSYPADNMIDFSPFRLRAGVQTLNGKTALRYVRSRHGAGAEGSDFARAKRQQKFIEATKQKALTVGVLANPRKISELISIMGSHVKTDLSVKDMQRFFDLWKSVDGSKILSKVLDNGAAGPLVSQSGDERGYILLPRTGDYSEVQEIAHSIFTDPYLRQEGATISLINASGIPATGVTATRLLKSYGYTVSDETPKGQKIEKTTVLLDRTGTKPFTIKFLQDRFKTHAVLKKTTDTTVSNIVLTIGTDYRPPRLESKSTKVSPKSTSTPTVKPTITPKVRGTTNESATQ